ncbi:MAG: hypothetical protein ABDH28_04530 [Brevinematia bacterium]
MNKVIPVFIPTGLTALLLILAIFIVAYGESNAVTPEYNHNGLESESRGSSVEPTDLTLETFYTDVSSTLATDVEFEIEEYPSHLDYVIGDDLYVAGVDEISKEEEIEAITEKIRSYKTGYDEELFKELLLEEEKSKREYYRLEKPVVAVDIEQLESRVVARGNVVFGISYGSIKKLPDLSFQPSSYIKENFNINQDMRVVSTSKIGNKVNVDIEFDQKSAINRFNVSYKEPEQTTSLPQSSVTHSLEMQKSVDTKPFVRELSFGDVRFSKTPSKYMAYTAIAQSAQGVKFVGKKDKFSLEAIATLSTTIPTKRSFTGVKRVTEKVIKDIDFVKRKFFKLPDRNVDVASLAVFVSISSPENAEVFIDGIPFRRLVSGDEYLFDRFSSELELKYSIESSRFLAVFYTHNSGIGITFSTNIYKGSGSDGRSYLYLLNPNVGYSPYELKNVYLVGSTELSLSHTFEITVYYTQDPTILSPLQFLPTDYTIDLNKGRIKFNSLTPFLTNANYNIYTLTRDPLDAESTYTMRVRYYESVVSYQLDFDIVENSEEVRINGVLVPKDKYTLLYPIGRIVFKDPTLISEGDKVEISYEYRPFFGGSQKISLGAVSEYQLLDFSMLKLSTGFWTSQSGGIAPRIGTSSPEAGLITSVINRVDFKNLFGVKSDKFTSYIDLEYAFSVVNPNSFGSAIVEDFESGKKSLLLSKDEDAWYLASPSTTDGCYYTNRGMIYYKDYRQYYANESFTLMSYNWSLPSEQILPYSQKAGPYIVGGGRLSLGDFPNVSQYSLVLDYEFSGGEWVGVMLSVNPSGLDLSDLSEIIVSYKIQMDNDRDNSYDDNNTNSVLFILQLGRFSEDLDGDGKLDYEVTTSQNGFEFNNPVDNTVMTRIGGGRRGSGNGRIDTEDLDKNGRLDTNENFISLSNTLEGSGWKQLVLKLRTLTSSELEILKKTYMVRLILKKLAGDKGRVLIDEIQLKFRTTPVYKVDGIIVSAPYQINSTSISVYDSPLYLRNRFFNIEAKTAEEKERLQEYSHLHGTSGMSISEAKSIDETSLRVTYSLSNVPINTNFSPYQGGREALVSIRFNASQNFSPYSKLVMYIFIPTKNEMGLPIKLGNDTFSDESIVIKLVTKEKDWFEFLIPMDRLRKDYWNRLEIRIREDYRLIINNNVYDVVLPTIVGFPSVRDINSIELGVRVNTNSTEPSNTGEIWFNELFLTGVNWYVSSALNSSFLLSYADELRLLGFPVLSNPYVTFLLENIFPNFRGTGGKDNANIFTFTYYYSSDFLKYLGLNHSFSLSRDTSSKDPTLPEYLLYDNITRAFRYSLASKHNIAFLPSISYSFSDRYVSLSQNGLVTIGTNLVMHNMLSEEIGLDSQGIVSYTVPFVEKYFSLKNTLTLSSSYSAKNYNTTTNNIYYFHSPSYQNWIYSLSLDSFFNHSFLSVNNSFKHSETFDFTETNVIPFVEEISESSVFQRNYYSLVLLSEGFKERGRRKEVYESDTLSISLANLFKTVNFYITPVYEFKDFNFREVSNSLFRDTQMIGKVTYKLDFMINRFIFNSVSLNSSLNTTFSANLVNYELKWYDFYTNNLYRGVVAIPFYEYSGLFGYENLSNALVFVSNLYNVRSVVNQFTSSGISISLQQTENILLSLIPRSYTFDYSTTTVRELSSFRQSTKVLVTAVSYIPIYKLDWFIFRRTTNVSVNDIAVSFTFSRDENLNSLTMMDKVNFSFSFSGIVSTQQNFLISYALTYSYQDVITNLPSFYTNFGIGLTSPQSLLSLVSHNFRFSYSFLFPTESDIDLFLVKIKANSIIENKEELSLYSEFPWYNNNKFPSSKRRAFELNFYHETGVNFSDFFKFLAYLKLLAVQMSEMYVENDEAKEKFFEVVSGIEVGINLRVTF